MGSWFQEVRLHAGRAKAWQKELRALVLKQKHEAESP